MPEFHPPSRGGLGRRVFFVWNTRFFVFSGGAQRGLGRPAVRSSWKIRQNRGWEARRAELVGAFALPAAIAASNSKGPVEVYDSLNPNKLSDSTLYTIRNYHGQSCIVKIMNILRQKDYKDCGLFAIANATSICQRDDPTAALIYVQDEMLQHLLDCLEKRDMSPFPHEVTLVKRRK